MNRCCIFLLSCLSYHFDCLDKMIQCMWKCFSLTDSQRHNLSLTLCKTFTAPDCSTTLLNASAGKRFPNTCRARDHPIHQGCYRQNHRHRFARPTPRHPELQQRGARRHSWSSLFAALHGCAVISIFCWRYHEEDSQFTQFERSSSHFCLRPLHKITQTLSVAMSRFQPGCNKPDIFVALYSATQNTPSRSKRCATIACGGM